MEASFVRGRDWVQASRMPDGAGLDKGLIPDFACTGMKSAGVIERRANNDNAEFTGRG